VSILRPITLYRPNFTGYILFLVYREYKHFYAIRQEWLASPEHAKSASARTVMLNNVPEKFRSESAIADLASRAIKGPVEQVWLVRNVDRMNEIFEERANECLKLEAAEGDIQALAYELQKKGEAPSHDSAEDGSLISKFIPPQDRPTHRLGLPLISKKVDTLEYSPQFIVERTKQLDEERAKLDDAPLCNSVFIRFVTMKDAHTFCRLVESEADSRLISTSIDVVPEEVSGPSYLARMGARTHNVTRRSSGTISPCRPGCAKFVR
jgi:calcium permeable stress-gated cation channel